MQDKAELSIWKIKKENLGELQQMEHWAQVLPHTFTILSQIHLRNPFYFVHQTGATLKF